MTHFFTWLRREHRIAQNPAADLLMPRPDRQLPEATLSAPEMARLMAVPDVTRPLGLRDRAVLEVFYSCALRRSELIGLRVSDLDFDRGTLFVFGAREARTATCPSVERALFWVRLYLGLVRPLSARDDTRGAVPFLGRDAPVCGLALPQGPLVPARSAHR